MSKLKPFFKNPKKLGHKIIIDDFNNQICIADCEYSRDRIFESITELEQLRAENARLTEIAAEKATRMDELYEALGVILGECELIQNDLPFTFEYELEVLNKKQSGW